MLTPSTLAASFLFLSAATLAASPATCIDCTCIANTTYQCSADNARIISDELIAEDTLTYVPGSSPVQIKAQDDCCLYAYLPDGGNPSYARDLGYGLNQTIISKCAGGTGFLGGFGSAGGNTAEKLTLQKCGTTVQYPPFADHKGPLPGQPDCCPL